MIGEVLGSYRVVAPLGEGGMGQVYVAEHTLIGRKAAVKVLRSEYSDNPAIVGRFFNEARATALLKHPGLVDVFDFGHHKSGVAYLIMELLIGESLQARLRREPVLAPPLALEIGRQVAAAVGAAHEQGIIHRDLKPDNIFLVEDRTQALGFRVKVLDFGIAKLTGEAVPGSGRTHTGAVLGTPPYMAPEQCRDSSRMDHRADVYSLGCIVFQMCCGRTPFVCTSMGEYLVSHIRDEPPAPRALQPALPVALEAGIQRMLSKSPDERPQTMAAVEALLAGAIRGGGSVADQLTVMESAFDTNAVKALLGTAAQAASRAPAEASSSRHLTTLSHAAGETSGRSAAEGPRGGRNYVALAGALGILALGGGGIVVSRILPRAGSMTPALSPSRAPPAAPIAGVAPAPSPPPLPAAAPTTQVVAPARRSHLRIESTPPGAQVVREDGEALGAAPVVDDLPRSTTRTRYRLQLEGFVTQVIALIPDGDRTERVTLVASSPSASGSPSASASPPSPSPSPSPSSPSPSATAPGHARGAARSGAARKDPQRVETAPVGNSMLNPFGE